MAHIDLENGHTVRVRILELILLPAYLGIRVEHRMGKNIRRENVSPIYLMAVHVAWWSEQCVSDVEEGEFREKIVQEVLPPLRLPQELNEKLTQEQKESFSWQVRQVDRLAKRLQ